MKRVTLNGIKRRGLIEWKGREWWRHQTVSIWSSEHLAWWRPEAQGYTDDAEQAWAVDFPTAYDHTKHCGPEKQIVYYVVPPAHQSAPEVSASHRSGERDPSVTPDYPGADTVLSSAEGKSE